MKSHRCGSAVAVVAVAMKELHVQPNRIGSAGHIEAFVRRGVEERRVNLAPGGRAGHRGACATPAMPRDRPMAIVPTAKDRVVRRSFTRNTFLRSLNKFLIIRTTCVSPPRLVRPGCQFGRCQLAYTRLCIDQGRPLRGTSATGRWRPRWEELAGVVPQPGQRDLGGRLRRPGLASGRSSPSAARPGHARSSTSIRSRLARPRISPARSACRSA